MEISIIKNEGVKRKAPVAMTGAFFLGICINYPNGLFNFSSFQI